MHLKSLHVRNFRCFADLQIDFEDDLTVIVAVNGGGKTTLADAIAAAFAPWVAEFIVWNSDEGPISPVEYLALKDLRRGEHGQLNSIRTRQRLGTRKGDFSPWRTSIVSLAQ